MASNLLTGGPQARRAWLDWGVFHPEPTFFSLWGRVASAGNSAMRCCARAASIASWRSGIRALVRLGVNWRFRASYCQTITLIKGDDGGFSAGIRHQPRFLSGLGERLPSATCWRRGSERDRSLGVHWGRSAEGGCAASRRTVPAQDILSRGQLKLLVCAMRLAQGLYLNQHSSRGCIF